MNNTRKITISIDIEQVLKTVYAESACLALMSGRDSRPAVISSDNRRLLGVYCLNAWLCLAGELASIVDSQQNVFKRLSHKKDFKLINDVYSVFFFVLFRLGYY
jgi:hypothetical protein